MKVGFDVRDRSNLRRIVRFVLLAVIIGLGVNTLLSAFMDRAQVLNALRNVRVVYFVIPLALFVLSHVVDTLRLKLVLWQFRIHVTFVQAFYNSAAGTFFTNITPMTAGGQPFQIYHLSSVGVPADTSTNVIMSRFVEQAMTSLVISLIFLTQIPWIASSLGMGSKFVYIALGISLSVTILLLLLLIRPHFVGRLAIALERTLLGRLIGRITGRHNWAPSMHRWSHRLRENVQMLWSKKTWAMILDILLGVVNIVLHAYSLLFVLEGVVGVHLPFVTVMIIYVILWQVVFYVPTPGASGGVEGAFALVYSGLTNALGQTVIAVLVWRFATYYLLLVFDGLVYALLGRSAGTSVRRVAGKA
ncbi:MAG TPA: lysylphosphatidylglycerol synthase transmembrane domain-containing protein [Spirochaetia bacterium]|nr:lysylphosphatidylglycerol synthase transmembrane domain-containing protein [Spirochaetia bacterium]